MEDIVDILGQNYYFEDFLSSEVKVDPQNKLPEKNKELCLWYYLIRIEKVLIMNKEVLATILGVASLSLVKKR